MSSCGFCREKDKETGFITKELGSFQVGEGALFVKKFFVVDGIVSLIFDTNKDVEEWEYSAIYDLYDYDLFKENNFHIEDVDDEYNPTFMVKFDYIEDYDKMKSVIEDCLSIIDETMENVFKAIEGKEEEYK